MTTWGRRTITVGVLVATVLGAAGSACDGAEAPTPVPPTNAPTPDPVAFLDGPELTGPTGIRLLMSGAFLDIDAGPGTPASVSGWLHRPGQAPMLLEEHRTDGASGRLTISSGTATGVPGAPPVLRVSGEMLHTIAPSVDGAGVWIEEYVTPDRCTIREVGRDGRDRRGPRPVTCGTRPVAETPHGLWVTVGPNAQVAATTATTAADYESVLLDPATLGERRRHPRVDLIDENRYLVVPRERTEPYQLHDQRSGTATPVPRPESYGWPEPAVGPLSPDGRYLPLSFGEPGTVPQVLDVWLLDLAAPRWVHPPMMPAYAALKATSFTWVGDGRLVLLGQFARSRQDFEFLLASWRVGDAELRVRPYGRPASNAGPTPNDSRILGW